MNVDINKLTKKEILDKLNKAIDGTIYSPKGEILRLSISTTSTIERNTTI